MLFPQIPSEPRSIDQMVGKVKDCDGRVANKIGKELSFDPSEHTSQTLTAS